MRYSEKEGLELLRTTTLGELTGLAHAERMARFPEGYVTYVFDTNPNYTNVCETQCTFCAFCRKPGDPDGFTLTPDQLAERVHSAADQGAVTVLMQGGHNPEVKLDLWVRYIQAIRKACPDIHIHPFSPPEIFDMARKEGISNVDLLKRLKDLGIDTIPGGGAEILSNRVRNRLAPEKCTADQWLAVMREAHVLGFRTTATMMYGHIETDEEILDHLLRIRSLQDETGGFSSFIPWSFKPGGSELSVETPASAHPARYVRIIAAARLILDNVSHIQSSWFSESLTAGSLSLMAGADDFGGILIEENVLRETGYAPRITSESVENVIRKSGFIPRRRDSYYSLLS